MSLVPRCTVCDSPLSPWGQDTRCHRCNQPCGVCGKDVALCVHPLAEVWGEEQLTECLGDPLLRRVA